MSKMFKKALMFTDIHFGLKTNNIQHNVDCSSFVDWAIELGKEQGCDTGFFLGDWHHHRASLNLQTLQFSLHALEKLSKAFDRFYFIPGNHDLYYRDKRDIHGAEWAKHIPNIVICNDWYKEDGVIIAPWLVGDEYKKIPKLKCDYLLGHFELPHFKMNAMVEMPDHGEIKVDHFGGIGQVFSGHFHLRQQRKNINYIGNAFPHNFADAGDDKRGCTIVEYGKEPTYHAWPGQPKYRVYRLSQLLEENNTLLADNMHVRVQLDIDISYEEANFIKETFMTNHNIREMSLIQMKNQEVTEDMAPGDVRFESVDQIVTQQLTNIESEFYDPKLLLQIYQTL